MSLPFRLGLRNNGHMVSLMKSGSGRDVLGVAYPDTVDRRLRVLDHWGMQVQSPRRQELHTIDLPLASRAQSILSHQLDTAMQSRLNGGMGPLSQSRRAQDSGVKERLHVGPSHAAMTVNAGVRSRSMGATGGPRGHRS